MTSRFIAGAIRHVVWYETWDAGDMFTSSAGVWQEKTGYVAYVQDGWGGGVQSKVHPDMETARADIDRLRNKLYGR